VGAARKPHRRDRAGEQVQPAAQRAAQRSADDFAEILCSGGAREHRRRATIRLNRSWEQRFEDAARLRDRIAALERVATELARLERLRSLAVCVVAPDIEAGRRRGFFIAKGQVVCVRPFHGSHGVEWQAGLAAVARAEPSLAPEATDELLAIAAFLRRPPPELEVVFLHSQTWTSSASAARETAGGSSSRTA